MNSAKHHAWSETLWGKMLLGSILPALLILLWWLGIRSGSTVIPSFGDVTHVLIHPFETPPDLSSSSLAFSLMMTLIRLSLGLGLAVVTAIPLGFVAGQSTIVDRILYPFIQMGRPINPVVLLPIAMVLFGLTSFATILFGGLNAWKYEVLDQIQIAMIVVIWWGAFFPIFLSTVHGIRSVRTSYLELMRLLGASRTQVIRKVILPHSLPSIAHGIRIALGISWLVLIAAEIYPGTRSGIGYMLCTACKTSDYQYSYAAMIMIGIVGIVTDRLLLRFEKTAGHWQHVER